MKQYPEFGTEMAISVEGACHKTLYFECRDGEMRCGHRHTKATAATECAKAHPGMKVTRIVEEITVRAYQEVA